MLNSYAWATGQCAPPEEPHPSPFVIRQHADWNKKRTLTHHFGDHETGSRWTGTSRPPYDATTRVPDHNAATGVPPHDHQWSLPKATGWHKT